ncbi:hypothetical protein [Caulobacter sp. CCG-8]|uniref:hypothetical protein n=1 Tax=Caulobacter sp. CCG-8 TaxID=3127958 RepID=UPI00307D9D96
MIRLSSPKTAPKSLLRLAAVAAGAVLAGGLLMACSAKAPTGAAKAELATTPISISSTPPGELNPNGGGAAKATLDQAAAFAWQEFIALNWPAKIQTGAVGDRDTPAADCLFGDPNCAARPLTWQTFRGKAEIFTAGATQPYDQIPTYADVYNSPIAPCNGGQPPAQAAWVNLDETTEITLAAMYAGVGVATPTPDNSAPQLIRFMAKANRAEFDYVQKIGAVNGPSRALRTATINYFKTQGDPPPGGTSYVSLPNNTIEIKAGWRMLNPAKEDATRFHTTKVRYYEGTGDALCYNEAVWGLVSLHIIQKTPSAPYFIYATFEQADNILTTAGKPVEDADGAVAGLPPCRSDQTAPCPTIPALTFNDTGTVAPSQVPPNVTLNPANAAYCTTSTSQLPQNQAYYLNTSTLTALPVGGFVCINYRANPIPPVIVNANKTAHAAIAAYNTANKIKSSPWAFYKLVNVQYTPIDKTQPGFYTGNDPNTDKNPASYYLANIMVETNRPLQIFSGGLVGAVGGVGGTGANSDYASQFDEPGGGTHKNTYFQTVGHDMGGCMGCHGSQGQSLGGDFSVILARGIVGTPESVPGISSSGAQVVPNKNRALVYRR